MKWHAAVQPKRCQDSEIGKRRCFLVERAGLPSACTAVIQAPACFGARSERLETPCSHCFVRYSCVLTSVSGGLDDHRSTIAPATSPFNQPPTN
jgi:hypothetical protein